MNNLLGVLLTPWCNQYLFGNRLAKNTLYFYTKTGPVCVFWVVTPLTLMRWPMILAVAAKYYSLCMHYCFHKLLDSGLNYLVVKKLSAWYKFVNSCRNYTLIHVDCKMKKRKRKLQKVCFLPFLRNSRTSNSLTKGLNPISWFCRCLILSAPASGAILETSLRVGVIPLSITPRHFFLPMFLSLP